MRALPDPESLRVEALARCGSRVAHAALESAAVALSAVGAPWESSHGTIQGVAVRVGVGPATLGALSRAAAKEGLHEAIASAVAHYEGLALRSFELWWAFAEDPLEVHGAGPYRGGAVERREANAGDPAELRAAVLAYLRARGEETELPAYAWSVRLESKASTLVRVGVPRAVARAVGQHPELAPLRHALEDLFHGGAPGAVKVHFESE